MMRLGSMPRMHRSIQASTQTSVLSSIQSSTLQRTNASCFALNSSLQAAG